jgi:hypothetical protein
MKRIFPIFLLVCAALGHAQEPTQINAPALSLSSINVTASPSSIIAGGTSTLSAQAVDSNMQPNVNLTNQCGWTSANPAIFTMSGNIATGVATGTANGICTVQTSLGPVSGSIPITVSGAPLITNPPIGCVAPCVLPSGTISVAYSPTFQFTAVDSVSCCTWSNSVGTPPTGMSLSSSGVLSGTPSGTGTTIWTVAATDTLSNATTLQVSITINATCVPGSPLYLCSSRSTNNPGLITAPISSSIPAGVVNTQNTAIGLCTPSASGGCVTYVSGTNFSTSWYAGKLVINGVTYQVASWNSSTSATLTTHPGTQSGVAYTNYSACVGQCQNTVFYDTTLNASGINPITRISDGGSVINAGSGGSIGSPSCSLGDNDKTISKNSTYLAVGGGGAVFIYHLSQAGGHVSAVNSGGPPGITVGCPFAFSWITDTRFYYMPGGGSQLWQGDITSDSTFTATLLVDFMAAGTCPGVTPFAVTWSGILGSSDDDDKFATSLGPGTQGSADWIFVWSRTRGCASVNFATGQSWNYCASGCSSSTPPVTNPLTGGTTFLGNVNTTTVTSSLIGTGYEPVASIANVFIGQVLSWDTGANQENVTVLATSNACGTSPCIKGAFTKTHASGVAVTYTSATCWGSNGATGHGIHDSQFSGDGNFVNVSLTLTWTQGGCAGINTPGGIFWQVGTTGNQWCQNVGVGTLNCGAHQSDGITKLLTPSFNGYNTRTISNVQSYTNFLIPPPVQQDAHGAWPHACNGVLDDNCPWIMAADTVLATAGTVGVGGCTSAVYCPNYLNNMIYAVFPNAVNQLPVLFSHTYECSESSAPGQAQCSDGIVDLFGAGNAIGAVSPDGSMFCWASSMLHNVGLDNTKKPRVDAYCVLLQ